jgi:hypothetical protein
MHDDLARPHTTLTKRYGKPTTPAMAAGPRRAPRSVSRSPNCSIREMFAERVRCELMTTWGAVEA